MVAALLHDIGKGGLTEHSVAGEPIAREIATRMGFDDAVGRPGRRPGALAPAAGRDRHHPRPRRPRDRRAGRRAGLRPRGADLLRGADRGRRPATSPKAWSSWRASLVDTSGGRRPRRGRPRPGASTAPGRRVDVPGRVRATRAWIDVEPRDGAQRHGDRAGPGRPAADVAALFATQRRPVRARRPGARATTASPCGTSPTPTSTRPCCASGSRRSPTAGSTRRRRPPPGRPAGPTDRGGPRRRRPGATVLEVRGPTGPACVYLSCAGPGRPRLSVRSAHVDTLGPQAVDVFYVGVRSPCAS